MKFASNFSYKTIFESLIDGLSLVGRRKEILDDINRQPIRLGRFLGAVFAFVHKISKQTKNKEYVGIIAANTKTMMEIFFALSALNRIPAMINFTDTKENILYNLKNVGITKVYTSKRFIQASKLQQLIEYLKENKIDVIYAEDIKDSLTMFDKLSAYVKSFFPKTYYKNICSTFDVFSPAVILFTSAFKGKSKAVVLSHKNIQASRAQLSSVMDFGISDSFFNAMPIFSSLGLIAGTLLPLLRGIKVFLYHSPLHYKMVSELVYDTDSTVLLGTDTFLNGYAQNAHPYDFYAIRYVIAGIEKLKEETIQIWEENFGKRIFEAYGTTETASTISINTPMYFKEYSVGRLLPSVECKLESTTAFVGSSHLLVKGPNVANCYIVNKHLISKKEDGEWFDTGDIVEIDRDGFVFMKGKSKRFTKVDGETISLTELEFNISNIWKESKNAVLSVQNNRKKEIVLFTTNQSATLEQLEKEVQDQKIDNFVLPNKIIVVEKIPIIGTGATDYTKLTEMFKELNK
jgi:acyl-[acyl-carrier-protein]-phospholipid O-acyltransferase/long-chain-fatty-acid--[acyl-carrier-protein] ligase